MELKDYTTEQLREELKRRNQEEREKRASVPRCRNCKHCKQKENVIYEQFLCMARTFKMHGRFHNYIINPSHKACDKYEKIFDSSMEYVGYLPKEFSSRKEYIEYLKEKGLAFDAPSEV